FYLDVAIKRTKKKLDMMRDSKMKGSPIEKSKVYEINKLESIEHELKTQLSLILNSFPSFDNLPEFYKELVEITLDVPYLKKSLGSVKWCIEKTAEFSRKYKSFIKLSTEIERINKYRREFYGRVASTLKQIKPHLEYLELTRRSMLDYPSIKTGVPTVALAGFPNVGKSTLLSKLTPAKPKIADYAFTTQGINLGYAEINGEKIQFMDTPGTLARFEKQNHIEKIATLSLKYVADVIVYVFDLTETYPMEQQVALYELMKKTRKPLIVYLSKTDILKESQYKDFAKKYKAITNVADLKTALEKLEF
ncbi:MAG TPA: GTPase, partial [Candidatus Nanoarchaeia archaeon]|nr:GTPase [Candidatus Nanoarchaeia archaeon]